jgi:hypothetical protein
MYKSIVLCCILIFVTESALAQTWQGGIDFMVGSPQGEFRKNVDNAGFGVAANIGYAPQGTPIMLGLEFGFMNYGSADRREAFSTTIPDVSVKVSTTNNFVLGHAILRIQPNAGSFRPYLQGMAGVNYLFTETKIENANSTGQEIASNNNLSDAAFSYGAGAGVMILVYSPPEGGVKDIFVDLGARYVYGGEAEYLKEGSIRNVNGSVVYDKLKSRTDLLVLQLGVTVWF